MGAAVSRDFILPDLGEGLTEAELVRWLVSPGDTVVIDQPVVEVESAKAVVELPSPFAGVVGTLHAEPGQTVHAGQPLLTVEETSGGDVVPGTALRDEGSGAVLIGYGTTARKTSNRAVPAGRFHGRGTAVAEAEPPTTTTARRSPVVSPLVRKLAREHGIDATSIQGSGPDSLVMRADVEAHIAQLTGTTESTADGDVRIPLTGIRKVIAERMSASRREVPEATIWLDVDATALLEAKEQLQRTTGERWSLLALVARFVIAGLKQHPILNSSVDVAAGEIVQHSDINLGLAAQTPRGLMVPVVHGAGAMTTQQLRDAIASVVDTAATGGFPNEQLRGGTFTLNNYGGFGVDGSAPIINQPEVAMLGMGRIIDRPWVVDGQLAVRKVMVLSMVFDHRVCDGDVPSEFITFVARCIESPLNVLPSL
nr:dihydrolipoamide acetyltransferase family protein [Cryobacterium sp. BB736]